MEFKGKVPIFEPVLFYIIDFFRNTIDLLVCRETFLLFVVVNNCYNFHNFTPNKYKCWTKYYNFFYNNMKSLTERESGKYQTNSKIKVDSSFIVFLIMCDGWIWQLGYKLQLFPVISPLAG